MPESTRKRETARPTLPARTTGPLSVRMAAGRAGPTERRDVASRLQLLHRITVEYDEMPGLHLTAAQAQRLFGLQEDVCIRVLQGLVRAVILRQEANGSYARHGVWP